MVNPQPVNLVVPQEHNEDFLVPELREEDLMNDEEIAAQILENLAPLQYFEFEHQCGPC